VRRSRAGGGGRQDVISPPPALQSNLFVPSFLCSSMSENRSYDWGWEHLLAENLDLLDQGWSHLLKHPDKAEDIPEEHRSNVLTAGYNVWINSSHLTTRRGTVLFKQMLNVHMVSSTFQYYRDCFLFALRVSWDVDVRRFDLTPDQSQAAFAYVDIMRQAQRVSPLRDGSWRGKRTGSAGTNAGDGAQ